MAVEGLPGVSVAKHPPANAGAAGDMGSIPGWEDPPEEEIASFSSILSFFFLFFCLTEFFLF